MYTSRPSVQLATTKTWNLWEVLLDPEMMITGPKMITVPKIITGQKKEAPKNGRLLSNVLAKADKCDITRSAGSGTCGKKDGFYNNQPRPCTFDNECDRGDTCTIPHQCTDRRYCAQVNSRRGICLNESQLERQTQYQNVRKDPSTYNDNGRPMYWFQSKNYYCASNDPYC